MLTKYLSGGERKNAIKWLTKTKNTIRLTEQRIGLAHLLVGDGQDRHVNAESLYQQARNAKMNVSRATVYNALHDFCAAGLMQEVMRDGKVSYYDTCVGHHAHFYIAAEDRLIDIPAHDVELAKMPTPPQGTVINHVDILIHVASTKQKP